jgi:hypothetical protein
MPEKVKYEREVKSLTEADIDSAISYSESRAIIGKVAEWRDRKTVGLTIRITPGKAVWFVRRREVTLRLGTLLSQWPLSKLVPGELDLEMARYIANQIHLAAGRKRNLREFADTLVWFETTTSRYKDQDRTGHAEWADKLADETSMLAYRKRIGDTGLTWTWKALTAKFLVYQSPKLKAKYRKQYEHYLKLPEFDQVNGKLVSEIELSDLERLRDAIHLNHAKSAVHRALTQSKSMLSWAWKYHATATGLEKVQAEWWTRWSFEYETKILGHKTDHDRVDERERMASVTEQHYNRSQRIGLKAEGMALWVKTLLAAYKKERQKFRDLRSMKLAA